MLDVFFLIRTIGYIYNHETSPNTPLALRQRFSADENFFQVHLSPLKISDMVRAFFNEDVVTEQDTRRRLLKVLHKCAIYRDQKEVRYVS